MKNSAWYHKIWLNKLNDLPLKEDGDSAWSNMEQLLDQQLPVGNSPSGTSTPKPSGTTMGTYFSYVISAAAMVGITIYFTLHTPEQTKVDKIVKDRNVIQGMTDTLRSDTLVASISHQATTNRNNLNLKKEPSITTEKINGVVVNHAQKTTALDNLTSEIVVNTQSDPGNSASTASVRQAPLSRQLPTDLPDNADSTPQLEKQRQKRQKKSAKIKTPIDTPPCNYSLEAGISNANDENIFSVAFSGTYALSSRWLISTGLRINTPQTFIGHYTRKSYFRPDSMPAFSFTDKRKVLAIDIPLTATYKLSNNVSINVGPVISFPLKQLGIKLGTIQQKTDTLMHTKTVYDILNSTKMNRINIGFSTGISVHFSQFDINTRYQILSPYNFSNEFGDNKFKYRNLQIGIGYRFK